MMKTRSGITLATAMSTVLCGLAIAQQPGQSEQSSSERAQSTQSSNPYRSFESSRYGQQARQELDSLDRNRDQSVDLSEAEADPELVAAWGEIDVNRDGTIDSTEYYLYSAHRRLGELEGEGRISQAPSQPDQSGFGEPSRPSESVSGQLGAQAGPSDQGGQAASSLGQSTSPGQGGQDVSSQTGQAGQSDPQQAARSGQPGTSSTAGPYDAEASGAQNTQQEADPNSREQDWRSSQQSVQSGQPSAPESRTTRTGQGSTAPQQGSGSTFPAFEDVDTDSDGRLNRTEMAMLEGIDFSTADTNEDGYVSREEYLGSQQN